jgi:hypothetical protein
MTGSCRGLHHVAEPLCLLGLPVETDQPEKLEQTVERLRISPDVELLSGRSPRGKPRNFRRESPGWRRACRQRPNMSGKVRVLALQ